MKKFYLCKNISNHKSKIQERDKNEKLGKNESSRTQLAGTL